MHWPAFHTPVGSVMTNSSWEQFIFKSTLIENSLKITVHQRHGLNLCECIISLLSQSTWPRNIWFLYYLHIRDYHITGEPKLSPGRAVDWKDRLQVKDFEDVTFLNPFLSGVAIIITTLNQKMSQEQIARQRAFSSHHASFLMLSNKSLSVQQVIPLTITTSSF